MDSFILEQIKLFIALILVFFVPGYAFILGVFGKKIFSSLERFFISFAVSIAFVDFYMLILNRIGLRFSSFSIISGIFLISILGISTYILFGKNKHEGKSLSFDFSKLQLTAIIFIFFIAIFIQGIYLKDVIVPSSTDLGHHMYWSKLFADEGRIFDYTKKDILEVDSSFKLGPSMRISDFIIGEHLVFTAVNIISGVNFISYFPILILFLVNIMTLVAIFCLTIRLFSSHPEAKNISIATLFIAGPLFAILPPQAKFVGGGVVGNIIGNLLIISCFYALFRAFDKKNSKLSALFLFLAMGLFYTHHLTAFVFIFTLLVFSLIFLLANIKRLKDVFLEFSKIFFTWRTFIFVIFAIAFAFFVYTPSYIENQAVNTVVGEVSKQGHEGLSIFQFRSIVGEGRIALGITGLIFLIIGFRKNKFGYLLVFSWTLTLFFISVFPEIFKIDIPSGRIANYSTYPFSIVAGFSLVYVFSLMREKTKPVIFASSKFIFPALVMIMVFLTSSGSKENAQYLSSKNDFVKTFQTFNASKYLSSKIGSRDNLVSDHIYLNADSWIKLFFMRDYNFPLYRANLERYENGVDKTENCTLLMISNPNDSKSQKCFSDIGVNYVMVNSNLDSPQFERSKDFSKIYENGGVNIFFR